MAVRKTKSTGKATGRACPKKARSVPSLAKTPPPVATGGGRNKAVTTLLQDELIPSPPSAAVVMVQASAAMARVHHPGLVGGNASSSSGGDDDDAAAAAAAAVLDDNNIDDDMDLLDGLIATEETENSPSATYNGGTSNTTDTGAVLATNQAPLLVGDPAKAKSSDGSSGKENDVDAAAIAAPLPSDGVSEANVQNASGKQSEPENIFLRLKEERRKKEEADESSRLASEKRADVKWEKFNIKPVVSPAIASAIGGGRKKGFGIHVAVIPGEGFCIRFDNYKVQRYLNDLIWKVLKSERLTPSETQVAEDMRSLGFVFRTYTWMDNNVIQRSFMNVQIKLFIIRSETTLTVTKDNLAGFFGSLCDDFINKLPVSLEYNITTSVHQDSFLWKHDASYSELIGTQAALARFKYEEQDMEDIPDPCQWFSDSKNASTVFKYFRPGTWTVEVACLFQPSEYRKLLSPDALKVMEDMGVAPSINPVEQDPSARFDGQVMGERALVASP